jgi:hypothetical protein
MSQTSQIESITKDLNIDVRKKTRSPFPFRYNPTDDDCHKNEAEIEEMKSHPFRSVLGRLLYITMATRPDILFAVISLSRFANNPGKIHWELMLHIVRYLNTTKEMGLLYKYKSNDLVMTAHTDAAFNADPDRGRSILGHCIDLNGCVWFWNSSMSKTIPQNAQHAEIVAGSKCLSNTKWVSYLLDHMGLEYCKPIPFHTDSQSKIATMENPQITRNSRHIRPKHFELRRCKEENLIEFKFIKTGELCADMFTKSLVGEPFIKFRSECSVHHPPLISLDPT